MNPLVNATNLPPRERGSKRQRLEELEGPATFEHIVNRAGIRGLTEGSSSRCEAPEVDDPRQARRQLAADLSTSAARQTFLSSLSDAFAEEELLHRCLLPIAVTVQVSYATGDSFIRMLLNMTSIQQQLATLLLHKLPEFSQTECDDDNDGPSNSSIPSLILGQLRWLEVVADAAALTSTLLEVLPVCSPAIQQQLIGFMPEVVLPQDHEAVVDQLRGLLDQDLSFMAAVLECISNMQLEQELQDRVLTMLLGQLAAVEVEDLPGLLKYLISSATTGNAEQVLGTVRSGLHFIGAADPRLPVPDRKQKGSLNPSSKSPELLVIKELVAALQANEAAATACLKLEGALQTPSSHRCFDLIALLALHSKGGNTRKAVEACLKKKLLEGHASAAWLSKSLQGHKAIFQELWPSLLGLVEIWARARDAPLTAAAVQLYVDMFVEVDATLERQQVLQTLHGHLGSGVAGEQDVALQALSCLATRHRALLSQYSSYLANVLDHLEGFTNSQLQQVFTMFAALTAVQPAAAEAANAAAPGGTRLQDELMITITKALAQNCPGYKRIGVLGNLALLKQAAADYELLADADGAAAESHQESWISRAEAMFAQCTGHPGALAFMMDQWADMLEQQSNEQLANHQKQQQQGNNIAMMHATPKPLLEWLSEKLQDLLNSMFLADYCSPRMPDSEPQEGEPPQPDVTLEDPNVKAQLWFNLDGWFSPVYLNIVPLVMSRDPLKRAAPAWMPSVLRLLAAVLQQLSAGDLNNVDALLGCPLAMPDACMFTDGRWDCLPMQSKVGVLTCLQHAICWLREVVAIFAPGVSAGVMGGAADESTQTAAEALADAQNKLLMRLAQLRVLEALYLHLATGCPAAAQQLPDMSCPLLLSVGRGGSAAAVAALRKAPAAPSSKAGKSAKPEGPTCSSADALGKLRCLRLPAAHALNTCLPPDMLLASLLPATHIAMDLQAKLKLLVSKARRPAGLVAPGAAAAAMPGLPGVSSNAAWLPSAGGGVPPCLQGLGLQEMVEQVVPLLPALQTHLATALSVIRQPPEAGREVLVHGLPGAGSAPDEPLYTHPAAATVLDSLPAAFSLAMACLQCFTLLLSCHKELPAAVLRQVLAALAQQQHQQQAADDEQMLVLLIAAFKACRKLFCRSSHNSNLQLELGVLSLLQAVTAHPVAVASRHYAAMGHKLSAAADALLKESWQPQDEAQEQSVNEFTWKGQNAAVIQLLTVLISKAQDPLEKVQQVAEAMDDIPDKVPMKEQANAYGGYAALCSATLATWYKVSLEQLVTFWELLVTDALRMIGSAGSKANRRQESSQDAVDWESAQVEELLSKAQRCCSGFARLVQLTKTHPSRTNMLASAVKIGGTFVDVLLKGMPFWQALYANGHEQQFTAMIKEVQKGTKQLQTICNEAKARSAGALLSKAPAAKKSLERFVFTMKAFLYEQGQQDMFYLGQLKHRDLQGNCVGSQLCEDQEEDEDENDNDDEAADDAGDEDAEAE